MQFQIAIIQQTPNYLVIDRALAYPTWLLFKLEPDRILYLAVPDSIYEALFGEVLIQSLLKQYPMKLIIYSADVEEIQAWIS